MLLLFFAKLLVDLQWLHVHVHTTYIHLSFPPSFSISSPYFFHFSSLFSFFIPSFFTLFSSSLLSFFPHFFFFLFFSPPFFLFSLTNFPHFIFLTLYFISRPHFLTFFLRARKCEVLSHRFMMSLYASTPLPPKSTLMLLCHTHQPPSWLKTLFIIINETFLLED